MDIEDHELLQDQYQREAEDRDRKRGQELLSTIDFGLQVQSILNGAVGQKVLAHAKKESQDLYYALANLDPDKQEDRDPIRGIRQRLWVLSHWKEVFDGYILAGRQAELEYQEGE